MSSDMLIMIEMGLVLGLVLVFGLWELHALRRDKQKSDKAPPPPKTD